MTPQARQDTRAAELARRFHEAYERLAPAFGYETRDASRKPWADVPANNKALMIAVCSEMLTASDAREQHDPELGAYLAEMMQPRPMDEPTDADLADAREPQPAEGEVLAALKALVYSAHPSKSETPAMFAAWQLAPGVIYRAEYYSQPAEPSRIREALERIVRESRTDMPDRVRIRLWAQEALAALSPSPTTAPVCPECAACGSPLVCVTCKAENDAAESASKICVWHLDDSDIVYDEVWETSCGEAFCFTVDGPKENNFRFCHSCGKPITVSRTSDTTEQEPGA
jgi:hypothetical protein